MRPIAGMISALLCLSSPATAREYEQVTGTAPDGTRYYEDSIVVRAPLHRLWQAFTDTGSYQRWASPVSNIDFRIGGTLEASYDPKGKLGDPENIKNELVAYIPDRLLVFRNVQAPSRLPGREAYPQTIKTIEFTFLDPSSTRVTVSGVGFGKGVSFDQLYSFLSAGDGEMLITLKNGIERPGI